MDLFVISAPGLEQLVARELRALGLRPRETTAGGVSATGSLADMQRVNLCSRLATRVLVRVAEFHASSFHELERRAKRVEWSSFLSPGTPVRFRVTTRKSKLYHSDAVAERLLSATGSGAAGKAGDADEGDEDAQLFVVRLAHDTCAISADSSGALLHRRGYRQAVAKAPLRETLAAAMLAACEWNPEEPLVDPMCGSGTIAIEGAMIARKIAPGLTRSFAFERWPSHDGQAWKALRERERERILPEAPAPIIASDRDAGAFRATIENAGRAGVSTDVEVIHAPVSASNYPQPPGWIITNPPYGGRVGEAGALRDLYARIGRIVREIAPGYRLGMLSADRSLESQLRLEMTEIFRTSNGGIPVRLITA